MLPTPPPPRMLVDRTLLLALRAALIQALNVTEDALGIARSVAGRRERRGG